MRKPVLFLAFLILLVPPSFVFASGSQEATPTDQQQQVQKQPTGNHPILNQIINDFDTVLVGPSSSQASQGIIWKVNHNFVPKLFYSLLCLELIFIAIQMMTGKITDIGQVVGKVLTLGFIYYLVSHFVPLSTQFKNGFLWVIDQFLTPQGSPNTKFTLSAATMLNDPTIIMTWASDNIIAKVHEGIKNLLNINVVINTGVIGFPGALIGEAIIFGIEKFLIMLAFTILAVEIVIAQIEFYIILLFALILVPFTVWEPMRFIGTRSFSAVIGQTLKLAMTVAVITIGMHVIEGLGTQLVPANLTFTTMFGVFAATAVLIFLALQVPTLAMALISGNPGLSAGGFFGNMAGIIGGLVSVGAAAFTLGTSLLTTGGGVSQATSQSGTGGGPSYAVNASETASITSGPTSGGTPSGGAQGLFQPPPPSGSPPSGGHSGTSTQLVATPSQGPATSSPGSAGQVFQANAPLPASVAPIPSPAPGVQAAPSPSTSPARDQRISELHSDTANLIRQERESRLKKES